MARDDYAYLQTDTDRYFSTVSLAQLEKAAGMAMGTSVCIAAIW